jgi:hypothetical protein
VVTNYRPVTLLNLLSKIFDRVIHDSISKHIFDNDLIYEFQSGFIAGHDTEKQLAHMVHSIQQNWSSRMGTRGVFLDIESAFDAIPHFLLIENKNRLELERGL